MTQMTTWFEPANFFSLFLYAFKSSLENTLSCSFDFFFFWGGGGGGGGGGDGHDLAYFVNNQSKSKVLGHLTARHEILISTSV